MLEEDSIYLIPGWVGPGLTVIGGGMRAKHKPSFNEPRAPSRRLTRGAQQRKDFFQDLEVRTNAGFLAIFSHCTSTDTEGSFSSRAGTRTPLFSGTS